MELTKGQRMIIKIKSIKLKTVTSYFNILYIELIMVKYKKSKTAGFGKGSIDVSL